MNMRIPFQVSAKGMENTKETRSEEFGFIVFVEHTRNDAIYGRKKAVKKRTIF